MIAQRHQEAGRGGKAGGPGRKGGRKESQQKVELRRARVPGNKAAASQCRRGVSRGGRSRALVRGPRGSQGDRGKGHPWRQGRTAADSGPHALQPCGGMPTFLPE